MLRRAATLGLMFVLGVAAGSFFLRAPDAPTAGSAGAFRCAMHPWVEARTSGRCTVCGMTLAVAGVAAAPSAEVCGRPAALTLAPASAAVIGVETTAVEARSLTRTLRVAGTIEADATRRRVLTASADGRIDKLYVASAGVELRVGDPLFALFSRELFLLQQEILQVARLGENPSLALAETRQRVVQAGFTPAQIDELLKHREPSTTPVMLSSHGGTVIAREIEEGQWVRTGDRLLELADLSRLWFVFEVPAADRASVRLGAEVEIALRDGATVSAPVAFIDPNVDPATGCTTARAEPENPGGWPRGALAEGRLRVEHGVALVVPRSAVLDTGGGPIAWIERGKLAYEPRALQIGRRGDGLVEVLAGVKAGERVVTHGALLLDAQAQLARASRP